MRNSEEEFEANPDLMSEEKLQLLEFFVDNIPDAVFWITLDGRFWNVNVAACKMLEYSREELLSMTVHDVDRSCRPMSSWLDIESVKRTGSIRLEKFYTTKYGRTIPVEVTSNCFICKGVEYLCAVARDISERVKTEKKLRENEEMFRVLAETSPAAICVYQGEHHVYVNAAMLRLTEYTEQELLEMRFWEWMHEDFQKLVKERGLARQRGEPVPSHYEFKCLTKSSEEKWIFVSGGRIEYKGKPASIVTLFDITDRKRMEDELQQAHDEQEKRIEERTLALRNANELLLYEINERKRTESVIMARLRLLRFAETHTLDELIEASLDEAEILTGSRIGFYHFLEADQKTLSLQNWSTRTKKEFCKAEGKGLHYDVAAAGVWVDCIHQRTPVIHNDYPSLPHRRGLPQDHASVVRELVVPVLRGESIVAILGVGNKSLDYNSQDVETVSLLADLAWEIAERKRSEEALRESEQRYRTVADYTYDWEYWIAPDGSLNYVSPSCARISGYSAEEFIANPGLLSAIRSSEDRQNIERHRLDASNGDVSCSPHEEDFRIIRRDGSERWIAHVCQPVFAADGRHLGRRASNRDITDRKWAEEGLRQKKQMLEELNSTLEKRVQDEVSKNREKDVVLIQQNRQAALGEMLDHIAHQWKQPLNSIYLIIQDLNESWSCGELTDENVEDVVGKTMALVEHMAQTLVVFRNFYRPEKEQVAFRLKDSIGSAFSFMASALWLHGVMIEIDVDPALSAIGYPNEYAQVLVNILTNARDTFKEKKVHKPVLKIKAFSENDRAVVTITDNAGGIPELIIDKIFELYFTTRESRDGTGIGLYMSKNIIEKNMGGKLSAANVDGGAQFRIEINMPI